MPQVIYQNAGNPVNLNLVKPIASILDEAISNPKTKVIIEYVHPQKLKKSAESVGLTDIWKTSRYEVSNCLTYRQLQQKYGVEPAEPGNYVDPYTHIGKCIKVKNNFGVYDNDTLKLQLNIDWETDRCYSTYTKGIGESAIGITAEALADYFYARGERPPFASISLDWARINKIEVEEI